jgi:hypothetical protein
MLDNSTIASIGEDEFNSLFAESSEGNPKPDEILGGKQPEVKDTKEDKVEKVQPSSLQSVDIIDDLDALLDEDEKEADEEEEEKEEKKSKKSKKEEKSEDLEDNDQAQVSAVLKNTVNYLVEKGIWSDWDGRDTAEIDENMYAEIAAQQDQHRVSKMFSELVDQTGPYGKAIIEFVNQGGNPDEILDIFKKEKEIENFSVDSEDGQKALITKYYKDVIGWNEGKIARHLSTLIANEELLTEVDDVKALYDKHHEQELTRINKEQAEYAQAQKAREDGFKKTITTAIAKTSLPEKEKREIQSSVLEYKNKLPNGQLVSDFYIRFAEIQSNPEEYIDYVRFAMNKEAYLKSIKSEINNKIVDKTFDFVKGNTALKSTKGTYEDVKRDEKKIQEFDFGFTNKRK